MKSLSIKETLNTVEPFSTLQMEYIEVTDESASIKIHLDGNRNNKNTMFAGSIYSVLVLTGWMLAQQICDDFDPEYDVVIKDSETSFLSPVRSSCIAKAKLREGPATEKSGNLSINVFVELIDEKEKSCAEFTGNYIGIKKF
jgi:thioesterase domain-containing protein